MKVPVILKKRPKANQGPLVRDAKKEAVIRDLTQQLTAAGYIVRREKLRQGTGWRAVSGSCLVRGSRTIFLDSKLPQDEQLVVLGALVRELAVVSSTAS